MLDSLFKQKSIFALQTEGTGIYTLYLCIYFVVKTYIYKFVQLFRHNARRCADKIAATTLYMASRCKHQE